nr:hypothetical protein Itr_chr10CG02820 [Ipomoea trifida]
MALQRLHQLFEAIQTLHFRVLKRRKRKPKRKHKQNSADIKHPYDLSCSLVLGSFPLFPIDHFSLLGTTSSKKKRIWCNELQNLCNATKEKNRLLFDTHQPRIRSFNIRCLAIINPGYAIVINMNCTGKTDH